MPQSTPTVVVLAATSAIAHALNRRFCRQKPHFILVGRQQEKLAGCGEDLVARGADGYETRLVDFARSEEVGELVKYLKSLNKIDYLIAAQGILGDQCELAANAGLHREMIEVNYFSVVDTLLPLREYFQRQGHGKIGVIGSVAGDRGKSSNYLYCGSKAALAAVCEGLMAELAPNVAVTLIKPGFCATPMTAHLPQGRLYASPDQVAKDSYEAITTGKPILYTPWFWRYIMGIIKLVPAWLFKRLAL